MLKHYLKVAVRNLSRNKFFSLINILGLAVGMGVCLLIFQYIHFESSYDQFHSNAQNTYRIHNAEYAHGKKLRTGIFTPFALGPRVKESIPEIKAFVRIHPQGEELVIKNPGNNEPFMEEGIWYVDRTFLQMFDFPLKYGKRESVLEGKHSIVITEQMSTKYFGDTNPLGKALKVSGGIKSSEG